MASSDSDSSNTPSVAQVDIEQLKSTAQTFDYQDMARYPEKYKGQYVRFNGKVVQKMDNVLRVNVTEGEYDLWDDTVYAVMRDNNARILEDDLVEMYGIADGLESYKAVLGNKITIPRVQIYAAQALTENSKAEPPKEVGLNQEMTIGNTKWKVLSVKNLGQNLKSDNMFMEDQKTSGKFIQVEVGIENIGTESTSVRGMKMVDNQNREFNHFDSAYLFLPDDKSPYSVGDLNPNIPRSYMDIYELPTDASGLRLKVEDLKTYEGAYGYVNLGI